MTEPVNAQIVPFPVKPVPPREKLSRALASLDAALNEQRQVMAAWRGSLDKLRTSTQSLGDRLSEYHGRLGTLNEQVGGLNAEAQRMEQWADGVLARHWGRL
jgi:ABC-type transporter Mla subunit MlaD